MPMRRIGSDYWRNVSQKEELSFHENCTSRKNGSFRKDSDAFLASHGFTPDSLAGKTVLDAGCGSILRTKFFKDINLIALDPLALEFSKFKWSDTFTANTVYTLPLETYIPELSRKIDYVFSINVLDHCFDFDMCIQNLAAYTAPGGKLFLSYDEHFYADSMHPLILTMDDSINTFLRHNLQIMRVARGDVYGNGDFRMDFWLEV